MESNPASGELVSSIESHLTDLKETEFIMDNVIIDALYFKAGRQYGY